MIVSPQDEAVVAAEVDELQRESEMPLDDFLSSIPADYLEQRDSLLATEASGSGDNNGGLGSGSASELSTSEAGSSGSSASSSDESLSSSGDEAGTPLRLRRSRRSVSASSSRHHSAASSVAGSGSEDAAASADLSSLRDVATGGAAAEEEGEKNCFHRRIRMYCSVPLLSCPCRYCLVTSGRVRDLGLAKLYSFHRVVLVSVLTMLVS